MSFRYHAKSIKKKDLIHVKTAQMACTNPCWVLSSCSKKAAFNIAESGWEKVSNNLIRGGDHIS